MKINICFISGDFQYDVASEDNCESKDALGGNRILFAVVLLIEIFTYFTSMILSWKVLKKNHISHLLSFRFVAKEHHFQDGKLYITCIATISDVYQARVNDAAVGILGNITEQTNQIVIGASPSEYI